MPGSPIVNLQNTYGAVFIGQVLNTILTGLEIVQAWIYYWNYWHKDKRTFKIFIGFITFIDILSTIIGAYSIYWYLVLNFGNVESLGYRVWATNLQDILGIIPVAAVQLYYVRRIYLVNGSIICPIIVVPFILGSTVFGIVLIALAQKETGNKINLPMWSLGLWMGAGVLSDILITVMMTWGLYRKRTGFARTDSMIMTLMTYTINSGLLMSVLGTTVTISFAVAPTTLIYVPFFWAMSKCYMNSFYAMLNSRDYVRDRSTTGNPDNTYNLSSLGPAHGSKSRQPVVTVTMHHSTTSDFPRSKTDHSVTSLGPTFDAMPGDAKV